MKTIVIVDDSKSITCLLKAYIRAADDNSYKIKVFGSTPPAADFIANNHVDLLFQDVHVDGDADGLITARIAKGKGIPVVIMTADSSLDNLQALAAGFYCRYMLKPITQCDVSKALDKLLK